MRSGIYMANVWAYTAATGEIECTVPQLFGYRQLKILPDVTRASDIPSIRPLFNGDVVKVFFVGDDDSQPRWMPALDTTPAGTVSPTIGSTADGGYFFVDGSTVANAQLLYPAMWNRLPTSWKSGGVGPDMVMPDAHGKMLVMDDAGATFTLGALVGTTSLTIASGNLPVHQHAIDHDHASFNSGSEAAHIHGPGADVSARTVGGFASYEQLAGDPSGAFVFGAGAMRGRQSATTAAGSSHLHSIDIPNFTGSSGNGGFANTPLTIPTPPALVVNWQIKY